MKISFDFDSTLSEARTQRLAKLLKQKNELYIISSRVNENRWGWNKSVFIVADSIGIPKENICFTNGDDKWKFLKEYNINIHFDDDQIEIEMLEENYPQCVGVLIYDPDISYNLNDY